MPIEVAFDYTFIITICLSVLIILAGYKIVEYKILANYKEKLQADYRKKVALVHTEAQEEILRSITSEIHDNIGQQLSVINLKTKQLLGHVSNEHKPEVNSILEDISQVVHDTRDLIYYLRANRVTLDGFQHAFDDIIETLQSTGRFIIDYDILGTFYRLDEYSELMIYRISQEIINNIIRHSNAQNILIKIQYDKEQFGIVIKDDGNGFDLNNYRKGVGLSNIYKRAEAIEAKVTIDTEINKGTKFELTLPYTDSNKNG